MLTLNLGQRFDGEWTPCWDANARGMLFGANLESGKAHFVKAMMEGVAFAREDYGLRNMKLV